MAFFLFREHLASRGFFGIQVFCDSQHFRVGQTGFHAYNKDESRLVFLFPLIGFVCYRAMASGGFSFGLYSVFN